MPCMTAVRAREIFHYDPATGLLTWKESISQKSKIGHAAGGLNITDGYLQVRAENKLYRVHRIAWLYMTGVWAGYIDHINGIRSDNRWANLRSVSNAENMQNCIKPHSNNTTGFLGVYFDKRKKKFRAQIMVHGEKVHLGTHETAKLAHEKYLEAKRIYHPACYFDEQGEQDAQGMKGSQ